MPGLLKKLIPFEDLKHTARRFPLATLCSVALCSLFLLSIHDVIDPEAQNFLFGRLMVLAVYGFFWFVLSKLLCTSISASKSVAYGLGFGVFTLLTLNVFLNTEFPPLWPLTLMLPALLLGISIAPFIRSRDNLSFWAFNRKLWSGVIIAIAAGLLWGGGLSAALASINYLFEVKVEGEIYGDLWSFALLVFAPLYALSWIPDQYHYPSDDCDTPPQLSFILNWVLTPLTLVYMLILYAYFFKIALIQELPRGQLAYMVSAFAGLGVITYLIGWPLRETGRPTLKLIYKVFFPALIIPSIMQVLAIYQRVAQYGFTEQRYIVALTAVWFILLTIAFSLPKKPPLKWITGLLGALFLAAAVGPFSAIEVAERSQFSRLERLLETNGYLLEDKITATQQTVSFGDRKSISSILKFFHRREKMARIKPWLPSSLANSHPSPRDITQTMGFDFINSYQTEQNHGANHIRIRGNNYDNSLVGIAGFDLFMPSQYLHCERTGCAGEHNWKRTWAHPFNLHMNYQEGLLTVTTEHHGTVTFDINGYAREQITNDPSQIKRDMFMVQSNEQLRIRLEITQFSASKTTNHNTAGDSEYVLQNMNFLTLIDLDHEGETP